MLEAEWLPKLTPHLSLALPVPLVMGHPAEGYPFDWSVSTWLPGERANGTINDLDQAAAALAAYVKALRQVDTTGAHPRPPHSRRGPRAEGDEQVRQPSAQLSDRIDGDATLRSWVEPLTWRGYLAHPCACMPIRRLQWSAVTFRCQRSPGDWSTFRQRRSAAMTGSLRHVIVGILPRSEALVIHYIEQAKDQQHDQSECGAPSGD